MISQKEYEERDMLEIAAVYRCLGRETPKKYEEALSEYLTILGSVPSSQMLSHRRRAFWRRKMTEKGGLPMGGDLSPSYYRNRVQQYAHYLLLADSEARRGLMCPRMGG